MSLKLDYNHPHATTVKLQEEEDLQKLDVLCALNQLSRGHQIAALVKAGLREYTDEQLAAALKKHPDLMAMIKEEGEE